MRLTDPLHKPLAAWGLRFDDPDLAFPVALTPELQQKLYFDNAAVLYNLA